MEENKKPDSIKSRIASKFNELEIGEYIVRKELIIEIWGVYDVCVANVFGVHFDNYKKLSGKTFIVKDGIIIRSS